MQYIFSFVLVRSLRGFTFSEVLQVSADLRGGGAKPSLRYEEIIQQVKFSTSDEIFNGNTEPISFRFPVGLL